MNPPIKPGSWKIVWIIVAAPLVVLAADEPWLVLLVPLLFLLVV